MFSLPRTPVDFQFTLLNVPVHVNGTFWILAAFVTWQVSGSDMSYMIMGMIAVFISLLVHEFGHALANLRYGYTSQVVLYYLGGFATTSHMAPLKRLVVVLAGPGFGFLLLGLLWLISKTLESQQVAVHPLLSFGIGWLFLITLVWNILNLLPVFPLDGGQAVQAMCMYFNPVRGALWASMSSFLLAVPILALLVYVGQPIFAVYIAIFGYQSFQEYQERSRRGH